MSHSVYFSSGVITIILLFIVASTSYSQEEDEILLKETTLIAGEELNLPVDCDTFVQVEFSTKNQESREVEFWYTIYFEGVELSEKEIGPVKFRTYTLKSKSSGSNKKTITLDCEKMDELFVRVKKGKMHLMVIGKTTH